MIEFVKSWCEGIVVAAIISVIIEMLVPQGNIKKYVRIIVGIYILFTIINPIITNFNNINLENIVEEELYSNTLPASNIEEFSNVYARAIEKEIEEEFSYIDNARVFLSEDLEEIFKIEIQLLSNISSTDEIKTALIEKYLVNENDIYINCKK